MSDFIAISPIGGATTYQTLDKAKEIAKENNKRVIFIFNYIDIFEVYPDGNWICRRVDGGMPVNGPDSEFIPKEGWSKFYGH